MVLEEIRVLQHDVGTMVYYLLPILTARIGDRRLHQPEVSSRVVDAKIEEFPVMIGIVFNVLLAGFHDLPFGAWLVGGDVACFGGRVAAGKKKDIRLAAGL